MSYRIEGKEIVISGFEKGIAESPYSGIADIRNIELISMPTEASVAFKETAASLPPVLNAVAFTASSSADTITIPSTTGLYEGCAISFDSFDSVSVDYLVAAGGGGGGSVPSLSTPDRAGGGGGAGEVTESTFSISKGTYTITVGAGGAGGSAGTKGSDGAISKIELGAAVIATAAAGGGGGSVGVAELNGNNGASGGGGGGGPNGPGTGGTGSAGNDGGDGAASNNGGAGGGGGAGGAATDGSGQTGGNGGAAVSSTISGAAVDYGGGGGGGGPDVAGTAGGGGGAGGALNNPGSAATANRGGGGGGAGADTTNNGARDGGAGGSGVVIISYPTGAISATGGTITTSGGNTIHTFTTSGSLVVSGLVTGTVYYVRNIVGSTFQLSLTPSGSSGIIDITGDDTGTLTTYQYGNQRALSGTGAPISYVTDRGTQNTASNGIYLIDHSNYAWLILPADSFDMPANSLIFLGNISGIAALSNAVSGISVWNNYILLFGTTTIDVASLQTLLYVSGPAIAWDYDWGTITTNESNSRVGVFTSQEDGNLYYTSDSGVGSIVETPGDTFDPADTASYTLNDDAISIPANDKSTCLGELGTQLYIGGRNTFVYVWDKISPGFSNFLTLPEAYISNIVGVGQNAYVFAGNRGRIYITNGASVDRWKKLPDYTTGIVNPYIQWIDASFARNQLYFTFVATTNADVALTSVNGAWAIDLETEALRLLNKITNSGYSGTTYMATEMPAATPTNQPSGNGLVLGWTVSTTYGVDVGSSDPYDAYESYIDTDLIPVGTFISPFTATQIEWKTAAPLVSGEGVRLSYRTSITESFTQIGESTTAGALSDMYQVNFQKAQWVQFRIEIKSTATTPSYARLTEIRLREFPN